MKKLIRNKWGNRWGGAVRASLLLTGLFACQPQQDAQVAGKTAAVPRVEVATFASGAGWGYEIQVEGRRFVYQPIIPVVGNNRPFGSEAKARRTGELVADKIRHRLLPPSLSRNELDSLGVLNERLNVEN
jgi:hypothetical protein